MQLNNLKRKLVTGQGRKKSIGEEVEELKRKLAEEQQKRVELEKRLASIQQKNS